MVVGAFFTVAIVAVSAVVFGVNAWPFYGEWCCGAPDTVWQWFEFLSIQVGYATPGVVAMCVGWAVRPGSRRKRYNWNWLPAMTMAVLSGVVLINLYWFLSGWLQFASLNAGSPWPWEGSVLGEIVTGIAVFLLLAAGLAYGASWFRKRARRGE
jgi:hypothetical protein